jgi:hypothetical protein
MCTLWIVFCAALALLVATGGADVAAATRLIKPAPTVAL